MSHPFLVADVGSTNTRLTLDRTGKIDAASVVKPPNAGQHSLPDVLITYQDRLSGTRRAGAAVAISGLVADGTGRLSHLPFGGIVLAGGLARASAPL